MRYKKQERPQIRTRKGFLFLPKEIDGLTRWWEYAEWEEKHWSDGGGMMGSDGWSPIRWLDI
jgi:hypothetical protein